METRWLGKQMILFLYVRDVPYSDTSHACVSVISPQTTDLLLFFSTECADISLILISLSIW